MKLRLLILALASLVLAACEEQGPAERLGENIDEGAAQAREAAEDSLDALEENVERAGDEIEDATN